MNSKEFYRNFLIEIQSIYDLNEATVITDWVFENIANIKKMDLIKNPMQEIPAPVIEKLIEKKEQLLTNKPVQYVMGTANFYDMEFVVNNNVLIPRPETEELTKLVINTHQFEYKQLSILDVGTGSGCIAIAIKKHLISSKVIAIDVSEAALEVARKNAIGNKTNIQFTQLDFLDERRWNELLMFDILVSNPPYIPESEKENMAKHVVDHEPNNALFVPDTDPLIFYKKIAQFGQTHLNYNGKIYLETHEDYAKEVAELFSTNYKKVIIKKDLSGKERIVIVSY